VTHSPLTDPRPETDRAAARHRSSGRMHRPAAVLTGLITAGSLALAGVTAVASGPSVDASNVQASLSQAGPEVAEESVRYVGIAVEQAREARDAELAERATSQVTGSVGAAAKAGKTVRESAKEIAAEKKRAAEQAAAEKRAAEQRAAEQAAAEERAAEQRAAEQSAASRSEQRAAAPAPAQGGSPKAIAQSMLASYGWGGDQWGCLEALWERESNWNPYAQNPSSGAYGIPQALPGGKMASAGADWQTNPATQIRWGLGYISGRYGTPCGAWAHSQSVGWY
jgi:hypothetical protein